MNQLLVRRAISTDIPSLQALDHGYSTDHVWQMSARQGNGERGIVFREVRLPRPMQVAYPRDPHTLADEWTNRLAMEVAEVDQSVVGYYALLGGPAPFCAWMTDLAVGLPQRRKGIATRLVASACTWCKNHEMDRLILEMQSKNHPAIRLATKMGARFCGYIDRYYPSEDIALFFSIEFGQS
jgi:GNAT superfamily N-acetyltransferase